LLLSLAHAQLQQHASSQLAAKLALAILSACLGSTHVLLPLCRLLVGLAELPHTDIGSPYGAPSQEALSGCVAKLHLVEAALPAGAGLPSALTAMGALVAHAAGDTHAAFRLARSALAAFDVEHRAQSTVCLSHMLLQAQVRSTLCDLPQAAEPAKVVAMAVRDVQAAEQAAANQGSAQTVKLAQYAQTAARSSAVRRLRGGALHAEALAHATAELSLCTMQLKQGASGITQAAAAKACLWLGVLTSLCTQDMPAAAQMALHRVGASTEKALKQYPTLIASAAAHLLGGSPIQTKVSRCISKALKGVGVRMTAATLHALGGSLPGAELCSNVQWAVLFMALKHDGALQAALLL
jgi:hypothetical protein